MLQLSGKKKNKSIYILALGGTISSLSDKITDEFYNTPSIDINTILSELHIEENIKISGEQFLLQISHEMTNLQLISVAKKIQEILHNDDFDGLVVAQGTNAIEETAYFINLVVNTKKPIVFTGAFRPHNSLGYDGSRNLLNAILIASNDSAAGLGVMLSFNDTIIFSREGTKVSVFNQCSFSHSGEGLLGYVQGKEISIQKRPFFKHTYTSDFNISNIQEIPQTFILYGHLGLDLKLVEAVLQTGLKGIICVGFGKGYQSREVFEQLGYASREGIVVVRTSRVLNETVKRDSKIDDKYRFIAGNSLTPQKARILLAVALNKTNNKKEIQHIFNQY